MSGIVSNVSFDRVRTRRRVSTRPLGVAILIVALVAAAGFSVIVQRSRGASIAHAGADYAAIPGRLSPDSEHAGASVAQDEPEEPECGPAARDHALLGTFLHLPIVNFLGIDDLCEASLSVQNLGRDDAKAVLVVWGERGFCPPQSAGPQTVSCTGLIKPGATWRFAGSQIPNGTVSAVLYRFSSLWLTEIGVNFGFDDVVADFMCETLYYSLEVDFSRFAAAYREGAHFGGVPLDLAAGDGVLAVQVLRECPSATTPDKVVRSTYNAFPGWRLGECATPADGHRYHVPLVYADAGGNNSVLYVQNAGLECAQVEIWFQSHDACARRELCEIEEIASYETFPFDASACVGPDFRGSAIVRSAQPLAIVTDIIASNALMTYSAQPERLNVAFDPPTHPSQRDGSALIAPIVYNGFDGWESAITVQSLARSEPVKIVVAFIDQSGDVPVTITDWLCAGGSATYMAGAIADLPAEWRGAVRVEAVRGPWEPSALEHDPAVARIAGVARSWRDAAGLEIGLGGALAYSMRAESETIGWDDPRLYCASPSILIAMPRLATDEHGGWLQPDIAVMNSARSPGHTNFSFKTFDQAGLIDSRCEVMSHGRTRFLAPRSRDALGGRFSGSAVVSAEYWEHDRFDERGDYLGDDLGLISAAVERPIAPDPSGRVEDPATGVAGFVVSSTFGRGRARYHVAPEVDDLFFQCLGAHFIRRPVCDPFDAATESTGR